MNPIVKSLLDSLDEAFHRKSWHGPNLRGSVRGLSARQAAWRPAPGRKSIAEQVLHAAYWKYTVWRRLAGEKRGSFPLAGSNWFPVSSQLSESDWKAHVRLLEEMHARLRESIASLRDADLGQDLPGSKLSRARLIRGIIAHDVYHAGQIGLLKRMQRA